ncbi:MAG: tetratricopeptide repeat protein [Bacteroidia bacterium]|nr:tetratricopeptide repeat protein [Bacteroidia bacterium]
MKSTFVFGWILMCASLAFAQPGGPGGLVISHLLNEQLNPLDFSEKAGNQVRAFSMANGKVVEEIFPTDGYRFYLSVEPDSLQNSAGNFSRVLLQVGKRNMVVDFFGIRGPNGGGAMDGVDSLVFSPGWFRLFLNQGDGWDIMGSEVQKLTRRGLTPHTLPLLKQTQAVIVDSEKSLNFLKEENLTASYYFSRAERFLGLENYEQARDEIEQGIQKNGGIRDCRALFLLTNVSELTGDFSNALQFLTQTLGGSEGEACTEAEQIYFRRARLYAKHNQPENALLDYDWLVLHSKNPLGMNMVRAKFKMETLGDYEGAARDLQSDIDAIPETHLQDRPLGISEYARTWFELSLALYQSGRLEPSFHAAIRALETGVGNTSGDFFVNHFDSLILRHPREGILHYGRAQASFWSGLYGRSDLLEKSLEDLNEAEILGWKDYRVYKLKAMLLDKLGRPREALAAIEIALKLEAGDPQNWYYRYIIRRSLGGETYAGNTNPDYQKFLETAKSWKYPK